MIAMKRSASTSRGMGSGIIPAMTEKMVGLSSHYAAAFVDANDDPLNGGSKLHLPPNIPAKDFWSSALRRSGPLDAPDRPAIS